MARLLSDGVCNAYLLDVWTAATHRRRGIGARLVRTLLARVPGQHVGLQTSDAGPFYRALGFREQPEFLSTRGRRLARQRRQSLRPASAPLP
jgi:GNAT superfamily N-acetyltransferase